MQNPVYMELVHNALQRNNEDVILDCAINARCLALRTTAGVGMAFVTSSAWERAKDKKLHLADDWLKNRPLNEVIPRYLENDPLWTIIALAAMNALFISNGDDDSGSWFADISPKKVGMIGDLRPFANRAGLAECEQTVFELLAIPGTHSPSEAALLLPSCDLVLVTSAVFSNKTLHYYLPHIAAPAHAFIFGHGTPLSAVLTNRFSLAANYVDDADGVFKSLKAGKGIRELKPFLRKVICHGRTRTAQNAMTYAHDLPTPQRVAHGALQTKRR